jgi:aldehyde dehydrogenase (NAD+)
MFVRTDHLVGGRWRAARGGETLDVVSPATEELVGRVPVALFAEVDEAVAAARDAFDRGPWPRLSLDERAQMLRRFLDELEARRELALRLQTDEMGATRRFAVENFDSLRPSLDRMVLDAQKIAAREIRDGAVGKVVVLRDPVGVVAGVTPWNSPVAVELSKVFPALLMGCPIVLKPAPESPLSAYVLGEAAVAAGLPEGLFSVVNGGVEVGAHLVEHPGVDHVTFTGSPGGGRAIAGACSRLLRPVTLELGGKSAAIVLPGVDMAPYLGALVGGSLRNCGQICVSTNRVLVQEKDRNRLVGQLVEHISGMRLGDPYDPETDFGPLAAERQREVVEGFIESGLVDGAALAMGGKRPAGLPRGWYVEPTVFVDVDNAMTIAQEEIFGPVLSVITYRDEAEAVEIANNSKYGLGGAVFAADPDHGIDVAAGIVTGTVQVNGGPGAGGGGPFAGRKDSGLGVERAPEGLQSFLELKSITLPAGYVPAA